MRLSCRALLGRLSAGVILASCSLAIAAAPAGAVTDADELTQFSSAGSAAGQTGSFGGVATDATTGHLYVADSANSRIDEFTPWGEFVKAFGWNVAPGGVNEQQEVRVRATAGQFKLSFGAFTTADLPFDANAGEVEAALNGLASIGAAGVRVEERKGDITGTTPYIYVVIFRGASVKEADVAQISAANGTTPLSGGNPSTSLAVKTRADGGAAGTGLEACTEESGCQIGLKGAGAGEFDSLFGVAVDTNGDIYVVEGAGNKRGQKFTSAGRFLLMFGGEVNKTTGEDVCTKAQLDAANVCGAGTEGSGSGEFHFTAGSEIAVGPTGSIFVTDTGRIQAFTAGGVYQSEVKTPGETVRYLAIDPQSGSFYVAFDSGKCCESQTKENVRKLGPSGVSEGILPVKLPEALATDSAGNVYVVDRWRATPEYNERVLEFNSAGKQIASCCVPDVWPGSTESPVTHFKLPALGTNTVGDLYVANFESSVDSFIRAYGPPPVRFESPPATPPTIATEYASSVDTHGATLQAQINPHFWNDTTYYLEYGTGPCSGSCEKQPLPPGSRLTTKFVDAPLTTAGILLDGLAPATTYHYRFVASSSGGGPVFGPDRSFTTFPEADGSPTDCPNQAFRIGPSAKLPDCRAYEMVSPVDKNGGDILALLDITSFATGLYQSSLDGEKLTYSSYRSFGDSQAAPFVNQYLATRGAGGWASNALAAARGPSFYTTAFSLEDEFKAFSPDLCQAWLVREADPILAPGAVEGFPNFYRRDNCDPGGGSYEALSTVEPPNVPPSDYLPEPQGASADGGKAIFRVADKLTPDASSGISQVYEASEGKLHLVCVLPTGIPSPENCSAGTGPGGEATSFNRIATVAQAISSDGSRIYWTASAGVLGPGRIFLRTNADQPQSVVSAGKCTEAGKACTIAVSQAVKARYWNASSDGAKALFTVEDSSSSLNGNLYVFNALAEGSPRQLIAGKVAGVVGTSEDLSHIYFASNEVIAGTSGASANQANLYLYDAGAYTFIRTLTSTDTRSQGLRIPSNVAPEPIYHAAQVSPDGRHLAFISTASLTGYDNLDVESGKPDSEVYVYDMDSGQVDCVSCNPSGARPAGREVQANGNEGTLAMAASIPLPLTQLYAPRALSEDGSRVFFNSYDALLPGDTNGKEDVYEWERAGTGGCQASSSAFSNSNGGCIYLITNGESPSDSQVADTGPSGIDVFFATNASLLTQDPGLVDIYDARAGGGFPPPQGPAAACEGEACQSPPAPPNDPTPASSTFDGAGNVKEGGSRCHRGKVRRKGRCVAKKKHRHAKHKSHHSQRADHDRGTGR